MRERGFYGFFWSENTWTSMKSMPWTKSFRPVRDGVKIRQLMFTARHLRAGRPGLISLTQHV